MAELKWNQPNIFTLFIICVGVCSASAEQQPTNYANNYLQLQPGADSTYFFNLGSLQHLNMSKEFMHLLQSSRSLGLEFYEQWQSIAEQLQPQAMDTMCFKQIGTLVAGLAANNLASYKYFDAWGKIPAGLLRGNIMELGNFDECVDLKQSFVDNTQILGKYCFAKLPIGKLLTAAPIGNLLKIDVAVCMPAACSAKEFDVFFKLLMKALLNFNFAASTELVNEDGCSVRAKEPFKARDWLAVAVLSILGLAMMISSLYEYFCKLKGTKPHALWSAFSLSFNLKQLLHIQSNVKSPNVIPCLNGIRCLSLIWVIIGHTFSLIMTLPVINAIDFLAWGRAASSQFIQRAPFAVDTFFFLSGFLLAFIAMRDMDRNKGKLNVPLMYVHRFLRLTPTLALGILLYASLYRHMGNGPIWPMFRGWNDNCLDTWWSTLLYVQNYVNVERMCLPHAWYLAVDMQLYILSPLFLLMLWKFRGKGVAVVCFIALLFVACLFSIIYINDFRFHQKGFTLATGLVMKKTYFITHARTSPWFVGLLFGYYMHNSKYERVKLSKLLVLLGWLVCLGELATLLFCFYPEAKNNSDTTALQEAFYWSLGRVAWPLALCWLVFACVNGYAGPVNAFLSQPLWQPLARLSYSIYIYHMIIVAFNASRTKVNLYFSTYDEILKFWGDFGWSLLLATLLYLAFEAPCLNLEKLLLPKKRTEQAKETVSKDNFVEAHEQPEESKENLNVNNDVNEILAVPISKHNEAEN